MCFICGLFSNSPIYLLFYFFKDAETGGFSDRPGDLPDPFHTLFGLAALSLLGDSSIKSVDPTYCMPVHALENLKSKPQRLHI